MTYTISATNKTLKSLIAKEIEEQGQNCSLNHIDVSQVTDMSSMFFQSDFNGDISQWDVSNVTSMNSTFFRAKFNDDISGWDTSKVTDMTYMFEGSKFNGDISKWNVSKVIDMGSMFNGAVFNGDLRTWNLSQESLEGIFGGGLVTYLGARKVIEDAKNLRENFANPSETRKRTKAL